MAGIQTYQNEFSQLSQEEREDHNEAHQLADRIAKADWYHQYSDDFRVRERGREETSQVDREVEAFAAKSRYRAEWISEVYDQKTPCDMSKNFAGYIPERDRVALSRAAEASTESAPEQSVGKARDFTPEATQHQSQTVAAEVAAEVKQTAVRRHDVGDAMEL